MKDLVTLIVYLIVFPLVYLAFAWMPMLGWNLGLHSIFPVLPVVTYMQAFWASLLMGSLFSRPQFHKKD